MKIVEAYPDYTFCWAELGTTDAAAAKSFYSGLFGWQAADVPLPQGGTYTMLQIDGHNVAALSQLSQDELAAGSRPFWSSYISVSDVDKAAEKAEAAGAKLFIGPFDVMDSGRMAIIQDPDGAYVGLWQPQNHIGAQLVNYPRTVVWNELAAKDGEKASAFYAEAFGWTVHTDNNSSPPYTLFVNGKRMAGGMITLDPQWGDVPPHWATYFAVDDVDETVDRAKGLGASVNVEPFDIPGTGRLAMLQDPQGASFYVMKLEQVDPPPGHDSF